MARKGIQLSRAGGFYFFFSLLSVGALAWLNVILLPEFLLAEPARRPLSFFLSAVVVGAFISWIFVRGPLMVFIHELKHSIVSNLVGNRSLGMKVRSRTGHFEYEYSKETEKHNALIMVAPYWFPLFTLLALPCAFVLLPHHLLRVALIGAAFGADCFANAKECSPHQTDLTRLSGGYPVGFLFVVAINAFQSTLLLFWVTAETKGLLFLPQAYFEIARRIAERV